MSGVDNSFRIRSQLSDDNIYTCLDKRMHFSPLMTWMKSMHPFLIRLFHLLCMKCGYESWNNGMKPFIQFITHFKTKDCLWKTPLDVNWAFVSENDLIRKWSGFLCSISYNQLLYHRFILTSKNRIISISFSLYLSLYQNIVSF